MARLTDLSTELLHEILRLVPPEDLDPISGSCRLLHCVSHPLLDEHRERVEEQYWTFNPAVRKGNISDTERWIDGCKYDNLKGWYTGLLCTVITDKRIRNLVKNITLLWDLAGNEGCWDPKQTFPGALPGFTKTRRDPGGNSRTFQQISEQALRESILLSQDEKDHWSKSSRNGDQIPVIVLLLENLTGLHQISIKLNYEENSAEYDQLLKCVERAATESQSRSTLGSVVSIPCQNLTRVVLGFQSGEWHPVTHITTFLALPSISFLQCDGLHMQEDRHQPGTGLLPHPSSIVELQFINTSMDLTALSEIFQNSPKLERFVYIYGGYEDFLEEHTRIARGPLHIIPALGRSVGPCFKVLSIFRFKGEVGKKAARPVPDIFKDFESLKRLDIDPIVLEDEEDGGELKGVAGILPASLEEFHLYWNGEYPLEDVQSLRDYLVILMQEAQDVLPQLQKISVFGPLSQKDEETLQVVNEIPIWRLSGVEREDDIVPAGYYATFSFQRSP